VDTYYIRHTETLDIDDATRQALWDEHRIAIHYPHGKDNKLHKRDNASLALEDYPSRARRAMRSLKQLAKDGGYVCAQYFQHGECIVGYIKPASTIELTRGRWGSSNDLNGRQAILKSLRLEKVKFVNPCDSTAILVGRPRQGTIMRWRRAGQTIENIVRGKRTSPSLGDLSFDQQEIMCSEFLRSESAVQLGLPKLAHLLLPPGRTMKSIDIWGISGAGNMIFSQVTYLELEQCRTKLNALLEYKDADRNVLILFCNCLELKSEDGVTIVPLRTVYDTFVASPTGKFWIERSLSVS